MRRAAHVMTAGTKARTRPTTYPTTPRTTPPTGQMRAVVGAEAHIRMTTMIGMTTDRIAASSSHAGGRAAVRERTTTVARANQDTTNRASMTTTTPAASMMRPTRWTIRARHVICAPTPSVTLMCVGAVRKQDRGMTVRDRCHPMEAMAAHDDRPMTLAIGAMRAIIADAATDSEVCCHR